MKFEQENTHRRARTEGRGGCESVLLSCFTSLCFAWLGFARFAFVCVSEVRARLVPSQVAALACLASAGYSTALGSGGGGGVAGEGERVVVRRGAFGKRV